ncbi:MAG TPA: hypothetical protein VFX98_02555 [Longimicrobiaceae bacterium]|nr:hypothetical protein [Longimicrobiaceae bacterium]
MQDRSALWIILPLLVLFPIAFAAIWVAVTALISVTGGWRALARRYAGTPSTVWDRVGGGSGMFSRGFLPTNYNGVLNVTAGPEGVGLSLWGLFRAGSEPLLIPWDEISSAGSDHFLGLIPRFWFVTLEPRVTISIIGRAGRMLARHWDEVQDRAALAPAGR